MVYMVWFIPSGDNVRNCSWNMIWELLDDREENIRTKRQISNQNFIKTEIVLYFPVLSSDSSLDIEECNVHSHFWKQMWCVYRNFFDKFLNVFSWLILLMARFDFPYYSISIFMSRIKVFIIRTVAKKTTWTEKKCVK